ncbi:MAG: nickel pincer cofactor biosynthesis protein LarC, partial [Chloroflexota bacterium]
MKTAYIDMIGGASGDMLLGALLDAGLSPDALVAELAKMPMSGYELRPERVERGALRATLAHVDLDEEGKRRRPWDEFSATIRDSDLEPVDREAALRVLDALTEAEARVHGVDRHHLQPHELGTVDTLVDIVGVITGLRLLGVDRVHASAFPAGVGFVRSEHGRIPATAPATAEIYAATGAPVRSPAQTPDGPLPYGECVTPTGAALVATVAGFERSEMRISSVAYGAGSRDPAEYPNVVALWLGEAQGSASPGSLRRAGGLTLLETNIDDMGGELFGYVQERLFESGALDVWMTPIQMKKSRPAVMLSALVRDTDADTAASIIMRETSTLGLRARPVQRYEAQRESASVELP